MENKETLGEQQEPPRIHAGEVSVPVRIVPYLPRIVRSILGGSLIVFASTFVIIAFRTMRRANTNVDPRQPATSLVIEGPFQITRNPLYLSMTIFYIGVTLLVNTLWTAILIPFILVLIRKGVIDREERYLERKFGEQYLRYKASIRRWL